MVRLNFTGVKLKLRGLCVVLYPLQFVHQEGGEVCKPQGQEGEEVTEEADSSPSHQDTPDHVAAPPR